jgi:hypothetical protein
MINYVLNFAKTFSPILEPEMKFPFSICRRFPETTNEEEKFETNGILIASEFRTKSHLLIVMIITVDIKK